MNASQWPSTHSSVLSDAGHGEPSAWQQLDHDYRHAIGHYATVRGLSESDAEDVAQEVFGHLFDQLSRHQFRYDRGKGRFRGWLARVIRQRAWRHKQSRHKLTADRLDSVTLAEIIRSRAWDEQMERTVDLALHQLREELQAEEWNVFDLYWNQRQKPKQIAGCTELTSARVAKIVFRCRNRLLSIVRVKMQ